MRISETEGYFESLWCRFVEEPMLFLLVLKYNLSEKGFSCVKTKTNSNFAVKVSERSNRSFSVYLINKTSVLFIM